MAKGRRPGPRSDEGGARIDSGTLCRERSPRPGPVGLQADEGFFDSFLDDVRSVGSFFSSHSKSLLLRMLDLVPFKPDSPYSTALLRHYVEGSGDLYTLESIPTAWQDWIVSRTRGRPGTYKDLSPYGVGLYDLQNALGHFDVKVTRSGGKVHYALSDLYQFGFKENDRKQQGRHGFPLGELDAATIALMSSFLPSTEYCNPGGFIERWEIKKIGKTTILFIPQRFLEEQGKPFPVRGSFAR